jgi:hypothetical protein
MAASTSFEIPEGIMAMTEDDSTVVTLLKRDPEHGAVYRHDGAWHPLVDPTVLDDLTFVGVTAGAESVYDKYEGDDKLVTLGHYTPSADGPFWPDPVKIYDEGEESVVVVDDDEPADDATESDGQAEAPVAASAAVTLDSEEDLTAAISAAIEDPDLRWYVERRVEALGLEADLPWQRA